MKERGKKRSINVMIAVLALCMLTGCNDNVDEMMDRAPEATLKDAVVTQGTTAPEYQKPTVTLTPEPTATPTPEQSELSNHMSQYHKDEVSARLVESGYYYEVNKSFADSIFQIDVKAITGDTENQVLTLDVYVKEEELTRAYDKLELSMHFMDESCFDDNPEMRWTYEAYGQQDETEKSLYHVTIEGVLLWFAEENPVVIDMQSITFGKWTSEEKVYRIDTPEYRFVLPKKEFYPAERRNYTNVSFSSEGDECSLSWGYFGQYKTMLYFDVNINPENIEAGEQRHSDIQKQWEQLASNVTLEADGALYRYEGNTYLSLSGEDKEYSGSTYLCFDGIDFRETTQIILWTDSKGYDLKNGKAFAGERPIQEPVAAFNEPFTVEMGEEVIVGRPGITLRLLNVVHEPDSSWIAFTLTVDGKTYRGSGACYEDGPRLVQSPFVKHVVRYVDSEGDKATLLLTEDYEVQKPLVLSGNVEDLYVTEKPEYIESERIVMFLDKGVEVPGNLSEQMESLLSFMEEETGFAFFNDTGYATGISDTRHVIWGQDAFIGVDAEQEKFHIYVVPHDVWWPSSGGDMIVVGPEDIWLEEGTGNTVIHEMAHAASQRNGVQMNRVIDEGFATYMEGKICEEDKLFSFDYDALEEYRMVYAEAEITAETAEKEFLDGALDEYNYLYGYWFITYLMENYGNDIYHTLLAAATAKAGGYQGEMTKEEMVPIVKSVTSETIFEDFGAWFEEMARDWPRAWVQ